jgi:uncharacterized protein
MSDPADIRQTIQSYGDGGFTVSNVRYDGSVAILPFRTQAWSPPATPTDLGEADLQLILDELEAVTDGVEILLVGWGKSAPPPAVLEPLRARLKPLGVSIDGMDTGAACRTFNLLVGESRRAAALMIAVA